jgi:hypothetical protein
MVPALLQRMQVHHYNYILHTFFFICLLVKV